MSQFQFRPTGYNLLPDVVKNLLIINGLMFLLTIVSQEKLGLDLTAILGLHFPGSEDFRPWQFVTHIFMHGGFWHLASNMFMLWMLGFTLENLWGSRRFLTFYMVTGIGAAMIHLLYTAFELSQMQNVIDAYALAPSVSDYYEVAIKYSRYINVEIRDALNAVLIPWQENPESTAFVGKSVEALNLLVDARANVSIVGASGAVFGVLLAIGMLFPNQVIYLYFAIPIKLKWFVTIYGLMELGLGVMNNPSDPIAHFAHLGGMLFGYLLLKFWLGTSPRRY